MTFGIESRSCNAPSVFAGGPLAILFVLYCIACNAIAYIHATSRRHARTKVGCPAVAEKRHPPPVQSMPVNRLHDRRRKQDGRQDRYSSRYRDMP